MSKPRKPRGAPPRAKELSPFVRYSQELADDRITMRDVSFGFDNDTANVIRVDFVNRRRIT